MMIGMHALGELQKNHKVSYEDLEKYISEFEGAALKFSMDAINDARQRENYNKNVQRMVAEIRTQIEFKTIPVRDAAYYCRDMRNILMAETRALTSAQGVAVAELLKKDPKTMDELKEKYAQRKFGKRFDALSPKLQNRVFYEVVLSSGRPNKMVNILNKTLVVMGRVFIVYTIAYSIHSIAEAENKKMEAAKQVTALAAGFYGAKTGGKIGMMIGGPLLAFALAVVGGLLGGLAGALAIDSLYKAEEEEADNYVIDGL